MDFLDYDEIRSVLHGYVMLTDCAPNHRHKEFRGVKLMCRSIQKLRFPDRYASEEEVRAAALQFVRKVSGYRQPSRRNQEAFTQAVEEITFITQKLLSDLSSPVRKVTP